MNELEQVIKEIRPKLRHVAPQTYWASIIFGMFNTVIGISIMNISVLVHLNLLGFIPIQTWGFIFFMHGLGLLAGIFLNNYRLVRRLLAVGILLKSSWLIELLITFFIHGTGLFLIDIWSALFLLQMNTWSNFTPKTERRVGHE